MSGEKKFLLVVCSLSLLCLTVLVSWLFIALWRMRELLAFSLIGLVAFVVIISVAVIVRGELTEQALRRERIHYKSEIPLDTFGRPLYLPNEMYQTSYPQPGYTMPYQQGGPRYE